MAVQIRLTRELDAYALRGFVCKTPGLKFTLRLQQLIRGDLADAVADESSETCVHVAEDRGRIVGVIAHSPVANSTQEHISVLAVVPDRRRERIGISLKSVVLYEVRDRGVEAVTSEVDKRNFPMIRLNEKLRAVADNNPDDAKSLFTVTRTPEGERPTRPSETPSRLRGRIRQRR